MSLTPAPGTHNAEPEFRAHTPRAAVSTIEHVYHTTVRALTKLQTTQQRHYAELARDQYEDEGTVEFDTCPIVSDSEDGAYVQAWVWIPNPDLADN